MTFEVRLGDISQIDPMLADWLQDCVSDAVEETRLHIHVDTGRLRKSLRSGNAIIKKGRTLETDAIMGGVKLRGVVYEQDILKDVDYGLEEEVRHPRMRRYFIPALARRVMRR